MGEVLVVTSGKGGVGKTTTAANIGTGLAAQGKKVVLMDTDIGLRNLDVVMGLENRIVYDIVDIAQGRCKLKQGMIKDKRFPDLYLIPAAQTKDKSAVTEEQVQAICNELKQEFDYIIVDCPAGIEQGFKNAITLFSSKYISVLYRIGLFISSGPYPIYIPLYDSPSLHAIVSRNLLK